MVTIASSRLTNDYYSVRKRGEGWFCHLCCCKRVVETSRTDSDWLSCMNNEGFSSTTQSHPYFWLVSEVEANYESLAGELKRSPIFQPVACQEPNSSQHSFKIIP